MKSFSSASVPTNFATVRGSHVNFLKSKICNVYLCKFIRFSSDLIVWCSESPTLQHQLISCLFPLLLDSTTENLADLVTLSLERYVGTGETDQFLAHVYSLVLKHSYPVLVGHGTTQSFLASNHIPQAVWLNIVIIIINFQ